MDQRRASLRIQFETNPIKFQSRQLRPWLSRRFHCVVVPTFLWRCNRTMPCTDSAPDAASTDPVTAFMQDLPPGDTDEDYDAADHNNMFLSYFPSEELLGESAPSFVRPALLNWIVNNVSDGTAPTADRLRQAFVALQRSTMRPLPFDATPTTPANVGDRGLGVKRLSYEGFTGGNLTPGLNETINFGSNDPVYLAAKLQELARALAGRDDDGDGVIDSWDVDNDGDGEVDSVWIDAGLPLTQTPDGRLVKPLVSYKVEDLGGRVNINLAGNIVQARNFVNNSMTGPVQLPGRNRVLTVDPSVAPNLIYTNIPGTPPPRSEASQDGLPNGFGYGPAEIDLRQLFAMDGSGAAYGTVAVNRQSAIGTTYAATNLIRGPQRVIAERLGILSQQYGRVSSEENMNFAAHGRIVTPPGQLFDPVASLNQGTTPPPASLPIRISNDMRGLLRNPNRPNLHNYSHPQGLPVDAYGRGSVALGVGGETVVGSTSHIVTNGGPDAGDASDDPYEFDNNAVSEPDRPFTYADLEPLLNDAGLDRDLLSNRLVNLIEGYHNDPSLDTDVLENLRQALAESMTTSSNSAATVRGSLPAEFADDLATVRRNPLNPAPSTVQVSAANAARSPQEYFKLAFQIENSTFQSQQINAILWELMPDDLREGRKFNLNRPFGNGYDDDGDFAIDEDQNGVFTTGSVADAFSNTHLVGANNQATPYTTARGTTTPGELHNNTPVNLPTIPPRLNVSPRISSHAICMS